MVAGYPGCTGCGGPGPKAIGTSWLARGVRERRGYEATPMILLRCKFQ